MAEGAIERLGDMLRYTLKEDGRELVEFGEEYEKYRREVPALIPFSSRARWKRREP